MFERPRFKRYLTIKGLSSLTITHYLQYFELWKSQYLLWDDKDGSIQDFNNAFLSEHQSTTARATVKNIIEFAHLDITIPKKTGRIAKKIRKKKDSEVLNMIRNALYDKEFVYGLIFDISFACALRRAEVLSIRLKDFDIANMTTNSCRLLVHGKGNKERVVLVPISLMETIMSYAHRIKLDDEDFLFWMEGKTWSMIFKRVKDKITTERITPHDLRRQRATLWSEEGLNITDIKNILGHEDISTTQLYITSSKDSSLERLERMM